MAHKRQACVVAVQGLVLAQFPCNGLAHQYWQQAMSKAQYDCAKQTNLTSDTCAGVMSQRKTMTAKIAQQPADGALLPMSWLLQFSSSFKQSEFLLPWSYKASLQKVLS